MGNFSCAVVANAALAASRDEPAISRTSKAEAIIGAPSALERIRMQQQGVIPLQPIRPAAGILVSQPPVLDDGCKLFAKRLPVTGAPPTLDRGPVPLAQPTFGAPGTVFGTRRIPIGATAFDAKWRIAKAQTLPKRTVRRAIGWDDLTAQATDHDRIGLVNRWVNKSIRYGEDAVLWRSGDFWAPAGLTLVRRTGDCEDFAILKMQMLAALGIPRDQMTLTIVRDKIRNADHAVLLVRTNGATIVLDNQTDRMTDATVDSDYRPIVSLEHTGAFLHGY